MSRTVDRRQVVDHRQAGRRPTRGITPRPRPRPGPKPKPTTTLTRTQLQALITRDGRISVATYEKAARGLRGKAAMRPVRELVTKSSKTAAARPTTGQVGSPPEGFGAAFFWDRADQQILLAVFVNAADPLGVSVSGLQRGDTVQVTSASGIASFSKSDGKLLASLIGLVGAGVAGGASTQGEGGKNAAPFIQKATEYAAKMFDRGEVKTMRRDAFGEDPGTGHRARAEGGVLVTMPGTTGPSYSNGKLKERWLRDHRPRRDDMRPAHVQNGFFLVRDDSQHNTRIVSADGGQMFLTPWDHKYEDNAGFYKVFVRLTQSAAG